ncbi:hypothetical protein B0H13DRAFT_585515 [Mycena leptocephala]|nr:hypothetical protein B0H13DRAFT_585515 [Mycena leptocephala]
MDVSSAEATPAPRAPFRCTLSVDDLHVWEYIQFQELISQGSLCVAGGLHEINSISPEATELWQSGIDVMPLAIAVAYEKIVGGTVSAEVTESLLTAIGKPAVCSRGHIFAILRLLRHYTTSQPSLAVLCTEYIGKSSVVGTNNIVEKFSTNRSDPSVKDASSSRPSKRRRPSEVSPVHNTIPTEAQLTELCRACSQVPTEASALANPQQWRKLPFPFLYSTLPHRFNIRAVQDETNRRMYSTFDWMGREVFTRLVDAVTHLRTDGASYAAAFLRGPIGVGKSHLLAALALHLRRQGKVVVYIPHFGHLAQSPVKYMAAALLCAFHGPSAEDLNRRREIRALDSTKAIEAWYERQVTSGVRFYFLVDQLNGLESRKVGMVAPAQYEAVKNFLLALYCNSICVRSSSPNDQYGYADFGRGRREQILDFQQMLTEAECTSWMNRFAAQIPTFSAEELEWFHDYTGRIFLFYLPLLDYPHAPFSDAWPQIRESVVLDAARKNIAQFSASILTQNNEALEQNYLEGVKAFVTGTSTTGILEDLIDHRYCVVDGSRGRVTCGLARRELIALLEKHDRSIALSAEWLDGGLSHAIDSPPVLDFWIKESVIATMLSGVAAPGLANWGAVQKHVLPSGCALPRDLPSSLRESGQIKSLLVVPEVFNFKAIDCLYIRVDNVAKRVLLIPIQISLADEHKDSAEAFYTHWREWAVQFSGYELQTEFLWVVERYKPGTEIKTTADQRSTRSGDRHGTSYTQYFVHLRDVAPRVWENLTNARQRQQIDAMED